MSQVEMFVAAPGKCAQLHALWQHTAAAQGVAIMARKDAVKLGEERGFNPATARTQFQVWFKRHAANVQPAAAVRAEPPAGTEEFAAHIPQSQQDSPVADVPSESPAAPVVDEPVVELTKAQKKALAKAQRDAAVA